jgi:hypothetical protein
MMINKQRTAPSDRHAASKIWLSRLLTMAMVLSNSVGAFSTNRRGFGVDAPSQRQSSVFVATNLLMTRVPAPFTLPEGEIHSDSSDACTVQQGYTHRRTFLHGVAAFLTLTPMVSTATASDQSSSDLQLPTLLSQIKEARAQLDAVPDLIKSEKWDSVRAILITPPLSDCWAKGAKPTLQKYAEAIGGADGDELAVLESRDDLASSLRFLDMAVYNNIFNPIKAEGSSGATKELVRSYYEDPLTEYKASLATLDALIEQAK